MTAPKRTYEYAEGMAVGVDIPGIAACMLCGWGAKITGADRLPEGVHLVCPRCAPSWGFGDGSKWVETRPKKRSATSPHRARSLRRR